MRTSTMLRLGAALLCCLLISHAQSQDCICKTNADGQNCSLQSDGQTCVCSLQIGPELKQVNCNKLVPKCWLMKKASMPVKVRRPRPEGALIDNDGLYDPDCEADGTFKARQCNNTETCWCVNSAGVRRTDKGDKASRTCPELVRTHWVIIEMKRVDTNDANNQAVEAALRDLLRTRYHVPDKYIYKIEIDGPYIFVDLKQNSTQKQPNDVDIADVAYYMEKDIKGDILMHPDNKFGLTVNGKNFVVQEPLIMFMDEKPHEISMKRLTAGVIAVIVVVVVAIIAGIVVLVLTRRKKGKYEKAEMKEMNEMQRELNS